MQSLAVLAANWRNTKASIYDIFTIFIKEFTSWSAEDVALEEKIFLVCVYAVHVLARTRTWCDYKMINNFNIVTYIRQKSQDCSNLNSDSCTRGPGAVQNNVTAEARSV